MRNIFFIRHALPDFPNGDRYCLGQTDFPLSVQGKIQAIILKHWTKELLLGKSVFCSKLTRAKETADFLTSSPIIVEGLEEMHAGLWDGLSFTEIENRWPEVFAARDGVKNIPIPGAEDINSGLKRFIDAVKDCLAMESKDIVIVAHSTVIQAFLAYCDGTPLDECRVYKLPYCSLSKVGFDGDFHVEYFGKTNFPNINAAMYRELIDQTGGNISLLLSFLSELKYESASEQILQHIKSGQI